MKMRVVVCCLVLACAVPATAFSMYSTKKWMELGTEGAINLLKPLRHISYPGSCQNLFNHSVIAAGLVKQDWYGDEPILAALLKNVGHVCTDPDHEVMEDYGVIDYPAIGANKLKNIGFGPKVYGTVSNLVLAKLLLVKLNSSYYDLLSERSQRSYEWQIERISNHDLERFNKDLYCPLSIFVRQAIDRAHNHSVETFPCIDKYKVLVRRHFTKQMKFQYGIILPE